MADSEFDRLTNAAKGQHIRLEPTAAQDCAKLCGDMLTKLDSAIGDAATLGTFKGGFGDGSVVPNAHDLAERYSDRADGGDSSLKHVLTKHREVVNDMMDTFIAAGRAYLTNENASAQALSDYDTKVAGYRPK
ncbi:hypothetical protein [Nocardia sp. BMG51109]|uniref:hypothetical protein n=1 Tax=Nocardia sp. BMG51109 TaxID=1056816 RepID=UPI0004665A6B|nr:hypothetical protein [Nocardia sp. BMG51109]